MASSARWRVGDPNIVQDAVLEKVLGALNRRGGFRGKYKVFQCEVTQALPNALADIIEGYTDAWVAADTADIHIESTDADDTAAGAGCTGVHLVYWQDGDIYDALIATAGAAHSHLALGTIDEIIGMYVDLAVTLVPQGIITLKNHAESAVYCTIVAGDTYSITSKMWSAAGWNMAVVSCVPLIAIVEAAAPLLSDGCNVGINVNGTVQSRSVLPENIGREFAEPMPFNLPLAGAGYICLQHSQLDTDATAVTATQNVMILLWED